MPATSTKVLFVFTFFSQFVSTLYIAADRELPTIFQTLYPIAVLWLIWWWLKDDSTRNRVTWPMDLGMFIYIGWVFLVPYHLFKTRGVKGIIGILSFLGVLLAASISGTLISILALM